MVNTQFPMQEGIQAMRAMREARYAEAIPGLERWRQAVDPETPNYAAATRVLIQAHEALEQWNEAIALCQSLSSHPDEALKHWSWKKLAALEKQRPINPLSEGQVTQFVTAEPLEDSQADSRASRGDNSQATSGINPSDRKLRDAGIEALATHQYGKAVERLERYLKQIQFANAKPHTHIALARAYCGDRQTQACINLCNYLIKTGDKGTQRWAHQFLALMKTHPKARDPQAAEREAREQSKTFQPDISQQVAIVALHLSIYGGLLLAPLLPSSLWQDLGQALIHQGTVTPELLQPLAIALLPVLFPLGLFYRSKDQVLQAHGREVVNYWITMLAIALVTTVGGAILAKATDLLAQVPLLWNLAQLFIMVAGFSYGVAPLAAIGWFLAKRERVFRYPFILRLL
jgi:uncharacterized Tic20 family protein